MSKEALTKTALDSLVKEVLPKLLEHLKTLKTLPPKEQTVDEELAYAVSEAKELLTLVHEWFTDTSSETAEPTAPTETAEEELSDDDAAMLLAGMDEPLDETETPEESTDEEMDDDEAAMLLADMDGPTEEAAPAEAAGEDMSDDEAAMLLADMDGPTEEAAPAEAAGEDMSDDEAAMLLADMDGPTEEAAPAEVTGEDMSDDEAAALLANMDGPAGDAAPAEEAAPVAAEAPAKAAPAKEEEALEEIEEFSDNDFSSDPEMMKDFLSNTDDLMETLDETILELEQNPEDKETIESIFRAAHTLKGAAGMFGFKAIERVMHRMENLFDQVRKGILVPNADTIDVVFQGIDILRSLLDAVRENTPSGTKTVPIVRALSMAAKGEKPIVEGGDESPAAAAPAPATDEPTETAPAAETKPAEPAAAPKPKKKEQTSTIKVDISRLDQLVNLVGELVIDRTRFASIDEAMRANHAVPKISSSMQETMQLFGRHMNEIQDIIMKVRMVPIGNAFNKFPRIVRDLSRSLGKEIDLVIQGADTELDKTLVEQIGDPLVHLIRNACDHGVEMPADREAVGKSPTGKVILSARQEGSQIIINIDDDGKGIPVDVIRKKGIEKGLISEDDNLSDRDIFSLIFEAGFSTAEKVTNVSGRGVGMDVVKKQISKLKGIIEIGSQPGAGSSISIQLPLTLAIVQSLLVKSRDEVFAIPLSSVVESVRIKPNEIQKVGEADVIKRHGHVLPLIFLDDVLDLEMRDEIMWYSNSTEDKEKLARMRSERLYVVIVGSAERRFGVVVDRLLHQQEMVIKPMGKVLTDIPCIAGGSVLGDGDVVLVLDIPEVEDFFRAKTRGIQAA